MAKERPIEAMARAHNDYIWRQGGVRYLWKYTPQASRDANIAAMRAALLALVTAEPTGGMRSAAEKLDRLGLDLEGFW